MKKNIKKIKESVKKEIEETLYSKHPSTISLEYLIKLVDNVKNVGAKKMRCIEILPGKTDVVMQLLNIISVECSASLGHPEIPQGAITRIAINLSDDPKFECQTIEHFAEILEVLKQKVDEQNRKNVVVTINFKTSLDPKKPHEKIYKDTRYFYDDEQDCVYFAVGYAAAKYIQNFLANNPGVATSNELVSYKIAKDSVETDQFGDF